METDGNSHLSITPVNVIPVPCFHFYYAKMKKPQKDMWLRSYPLLGQMSPRGFHCMEKPKVPTNKRNRRDKVETDPNLKDMSHLIRCLKVSGNDMLSCQ